MNLRAEKIVVQGMTCDSCEHRIVRNLKNLEGVVDVTANCGKGIVTVKFDANTCSLGMLHAAIEKTGYTIGHAARYEKFIGILIVFAAVFLLGNMTDAYDIDSRLKENVSLAMLFIIGLFTSLHCVGMCGGLMLSQTVGHQSENKLGAMLPTVSYNAGRVLSYTVLGGIVGAIGSVFALSLTMKAGLTIFAGIFMVLMGLSMAGILPFRINVKLPWVKCAEEKPNRTPFIVGIFNGLMPCGPLQTMQLYALGTGSVVEGASSMFFFALGTVPLMLTFGSITSFLSRGYTQKVLKFSGVLVLVLGIIMADRGFAMAGMEIPGFSMLRSTPTAQGAAAIKAEIQDGVQVIKISANDRGYVPNVLFVQKGIPVKWIIDGEQLNSCNNAIIIPTMKIEKSLKSGENVVQFTPGDQQEINFSCWMGMIRGVFKVVDDLGAVDVSKEKALPSSSGCKGGCCAPNGGGGGSSVNSDLSKVPTAQLIKKAQPNDKGQALEITNSGYELSPILSVIKKDTDTTLWFVSSSTDNLGKKIEIVEVDTKQRILTFDVKGKMTEVNLNIPKSGLYAIIKDREFIGAFEVVDDVNAVDLEKLREKYF